MTEKVDIWEDRMLGQMMKQPLNTSTILSYAQEIHGDRQIHSRLPNGGLHVQTYAQAALRCKRLANCLVAMGCAPGDRIATLAWNGYRHFELYYAITGIGAVCHTINPRLSDEQLVYIVSHAEDKILFIDPDLVPIVQRLLPDLPKGLVFVIMADKARMPAHGLPEAQCYEVLLSNASDQFEWKLFDEDQACGLCYSSGTTGNPKGALYSHRSTVLHAMSACIAFPTVLQPGQRILPAVPLFHVNAWGLPFSAPLSGAELVLPGAKLDGPSLFDLMDKTHTRSAWGVPTIWAGLLDEIANRDAMPSGFDHVVSGGAAASASMITNFETRGVDVCHSWGMTEMSPIGSHGQTFAPLSDLPIEEKLKFKSTQGRRPFGVDMKIVGEDGQVLPHDGKSVGELFVRGNTVVSGYFNNPEATAKALDADGWFATGDMATIDPGGFMSIADRAKDLIKTGGEWISSIDLENCAMSHPDVAMCAVIGAYHPKWDERPLLIVVLADNATPDRQTILDQLATVFAKWQLPDDVIFVDELPMTATGKISKLDLRQSYKYHLHQLATV